VKILQKVLGGGATFLTHTVYKNEKSFSIYLRTLKMFSVSVILSPLKLHQQKTLIVLQRIYLTLANSCLQQIAKLANCKYTINRFITISMQASLSLSLQPLIQACCCHSHKWSQLMQLTV